jgi:hypothetical protein
MLTWTSTTRGIGAVVLELRADDDPRGSAADTSCCSMNTPGDPLSVVETWTGSVARSHTPR